MSMIRLLKGSALGTLAVAAALASLPAEAQGREPESRGGERFNDRAENRQQARQSRPDRQEARQDNRGERPDARQDNRGERRDARQDNRGERRDARQDDRGERRAVVAQTRSTQEWNRGVAPQRRASADQNDRNRSYRDGDRNRTYDARTRDSRRDDRFGDRNDGRFGERRDNYRSDGRDSYRERRYDDDRRGDRRVDYREGRDYKRWDRHDWRKQNRYNWYDYRRTHRHIYHLGNYYAPYRHHSYRRLSIGFYLDSLFFGTRFWIGNPSYYRLPQVYGPYRWVRYYDDVLLVNIYSGEVVDVIHDFFW